MDQNPPSRIVRIVVSDAFYQALKAASAEEGMTISAFGRRVLTRNIRARGRDKSLQNPETDPGVVARAK